MALVLLPAHDTDGPSAGHAVEVTCLTCGGGVVMDLDPYVVADLAAALERVHVCPDPALWGVSCG